MRIRTLIVDDEPPAREGIRLRLLPMTDIDVVAECASASEAIAAIAEEGPDLLFLDVQMPGVDGIEMLRKIGPDAVPAVILVTAYEEFAVDAFEFNVVDYVLKPIEEARFLAAVERARVRLNRLEAVQLSRQLKSVLAGLEDGRAPEASPNPETPPPAGGYVTRFLVPSDDGEVPVSTKVVDWIESAGDYVRLHIGRKYVLLRESMGHLEQILDPAFFARIHRGAIVRLDRVDKLQSLQHGDSEIHLRDGTVLRLSRTYRDRFRAALSTSSRDSGAG